MLSVAFVATVVLVRSVVDVVGLCVLLPEAMRNVVTSEDTATASALDGLVAYGRTLAEAAVGQLRGADPTWGPVAAHVLEQVGQGSNGTLVVEGAFVKMHEGYAASGASPPWLASAEDLSKLVLWVSGQENQSDPMSLPEVKRVAMAQLSSLLGGENGTEFQLTEMLSGLSGQGGGGGGFAQMAGAAGSHGLLWLLGALLQLLKLCTFSVSLGLELLVFWTMTFYMLSSPTDGLTRLVRTVLPRASEEILSKLQVTPL